MTVEQMDEKIDQEIIYWIDTGFACAGAIVSNGIIIDSAPIFKRFIGQPITNLTKWKAVKYWEICGG